MPSTQIPGYEYGSPNLPKSPIDLAKLQLLKQPVLFTDEDARYLRQAGEVLAEQIEDVLDVWYGFVGSHPHLLDYFRRPDGEPDPAHLVAVRKRFAQWVRDTCRAEYDQSWLDYQQEIALRHTKAKKNRTDGVVSETSHVPLRYMIAFIYPITATIRPFLEKRGHAAEEVGKMYQAWFKSVTLQVTSWSEPYAREGAY